MSRRNQPQQRSSKKRAVQRKARHSEAKALRNAASPPEAAGPAAWTQTDPEALAQRLHDQRLTLLQRQALAGRIGRYQGNRYLQRLIVPPATAPDLAGHHGAGIVAGPRPFAPAIQRGEAGVHQDIEMTTWGVTKPTDPSKMSPEQQEAMKAYVGNWMRDFSQFFVPSAFEKVATAPKRPGDIGGGAIGAAGAESVMTGLLQALAAMEFGPGITKAFVSGPALGVYRPEEHMDNPAGMSFGGDVLVRNKAGALAPGTSKEASQVAGSAFKSSQVENPLLFKVSDEGLSNHIYNTKEWVKNRFVGAAHMGPATGKSHFAAGLHGVEDYFAHSNFIEVALNKLLSSSAGALPPELKSLPKAPGKSGGAVDTLYDASVKVGGEKRMAVTTGTFGPKDTQVSIAHALMPRLPSLFTAVDSAIDQALLLLESDKASWADIKKKLEATPAGAALGFLLDGLDKGGVELPVINIEKWQIPDLPDILPDEIEKFLEGRWIATGYQQTYMQPSKAIPAYQAFYQDVKAIWEFRDELRLMIKALLKFPFLPEKVAAMLRKAQEFFKKTLPELTKEFKTAVRRAIRNYMLEFIEKLTGVNVPAEKREVLKDWLEAIHEGVEGMGHETSLETRLKSGDLSKLSEEEKKKRIPEGALPPSHSEISKDHPEPKKDPAHKVDTDEGRSVFFEIHRDLAIEADKHLTVLMQIAWSKAVKGAAVVPGKPVTMDAEELKKRDKEAGKMAKKGEALAGKDKRAFAQKDMTVSSEIKAVLDAVELYISHPEDTKWWQPVMLKYIKAHPAQVLADIQARNKTRGARK